MAPLSVIDYVVIHEEILIFERTGLTSQREKIQMYRVFKN